MGNEHNIFTWVDNWHPHGPLIKKCGPRLMYDDASSINSKLSDFIVNKIWCFHTAISRDMNGVIRDLPTCWDIDIDTVDWLPSSTKRFNASNA